MPNLLVLRGPPGSGKTTVSGIVAATRADVKVVEVDEVKFKRYSEKAKRYGQAEACEPAEDFPEAGRSARIQFDAGYNVIAVEFFNDREHIDFFLKSFGWPVDGAKLVFVWFDCDAHAATARKSLVLTEGEVHNQHARKKARYCPSDETIIDTTELTVEDIVRTVLALLPNSPAN